MTERRGHAFVLKTQETRRRESLSENIGKLIISRDVTKLNIFVGRLQHVGPSVKHKIRSQS